MKKDIEYEPEPDNSGVEKKFMIRCPRCRWARISSGVKADIQDLDEIKEHCSDCGKFRRFKCKSCGMPSPMKRINRRT